MANFTVIFAFTRKTHVPFLVAAFVCSALAGTVQPATSILVGKLMNLFSRFAANTIDSTDLKGETQIWILALVVLGFVALFVHALFYCTWIIYGELQARVVREDLFSNLVIRDFAWFEAQDSGVATLLGRIQVQIREFQLSVSQPLGSVTLIIFQTISSIGVAFHYNWKLTLVLLALFPVIAVALSLLSRGLQRAIDDQQQELTNAAKQAGYATSSVIMLKCYNGLSKETQHYSHILQLVSQYYRRQTTISARQIAFMRIASNALVTVALFYGSNLIHNSGANPGAILSTFWCCGTASNGFNEVVTRLLILEKGRASAVALRNLMYLVEKGKVLVPKCNARMPQRLAGKIEFRDVCEVFNTRKATNIDRFVIGSSGSGKSTLSYLILKLYDPESGQITIDDEELDTLDTNWLRNNITVVQQESILFKESLSRNIALGSHDLDQAHEKQIRESAQFAVLDETLQSLPDGINSMVGTGGCTLSGGQRQRVALARARLRDTPILVLDECTSALDHTTKTHLLANIRDWRQDRTTIIITHDLSQIQAQDWTCILRDGVVVAQGFRCELDLVTEWPADVSAVADSGTSEVTPASYFSGDNFLRTSSFHANVSDISLHTELDGSLYDEHVALLQRKDEQLNSRRRDRGKTFRALLRGDEAHPLTKMQQKKTKQKSSSIVYDLEHEMSRLRKSRAIHNRLTMTQAARPYSVYPSLPTRAANSEEDAHIFAVPKQINISAKDTESTADLTVPTLKATDPELVTNTSTMWRIAKTIWPSLSFLNRIKLLFALTMSIVYGAVPSLVSWLTVRLFQTFYQADGWYEDARKWSLLLMTVGFVEAVAAFLIHFLFENLAQAWINTLRNRAFYRVVHQPKAWFDADSFSSNEICTVLDRGAEEMRNILGRFTPFILIVVVMVSTAILWCFVTCWKLTMVCLGCVPIVYAAGKIFQLTSVFWESRTTDAANIVSEIFAESFRDVRTVRALTLEFHFHRQFMTANLCAFVTGIKRGLFVGLCFGMSESTMPFITAGVFKYATAMVQTRTYPMQSILLVLSSMIFTMVGAGAILAFIPQISSSLESGHRLLHLAKLDTQGSSRGGELKLSEGEFAGSLELHEVTFAYPAQPDVKVLRSVDLKIPPGSFTSIVGTSGSGKSTIISLLLGLYPDHSSITDASIKISGHDIRDFDEYNLRSFIAFVPQQPVLLPMTIRKNILYGVNEELPPCDDRLHLATTAADIHDFVVGLTDGYDTIIGDGGINVSGGQAQRIAIARALACRPRILLMDEPTSALDPESAAVIRKAIRAQSSGEVTAGTTVVVVTHCEEMMKMADNVVVMEAGKVVEQGPYGQLMKANGRLRALLSDQTLSSS